MNAMNYFVFFMILRDKNKNGMKKKSYSHFLSHLNTECVFKIKFNKAIVELTGLLDNLFIILFIFCCLFFID
jgi:hypothetical protein